MTEEQIRQAVQEALSEIAPETAGLQIRSEVNFRDQFDFDSMDFVSFVMAVDKKLDRRTPEADYFKLSSLAGCLDYFTGASSEG